MSKCKTATACALLLCLLGTAYAAPGHKTRTKSNNSNDREGLVLQPTAGGGNACYIRSGEWAYAKLQPGKFMGGPGHITLQRSAAQAEPTSAQLAPICDGVRTALGRIDADARKRDGLVAAIDAGDAAAARQLLLDNGLPAELVVGVLFHAVNTKGTGANVNRSAAPGNGNGAAETQPPARGIVPRVQEHAVNTKGTGANNIRSAAAGGGLQITVTRADEALAVLVGAATVDLDSDGRPEDGVTGATKAEAGHWGDPHLNEGR